MADDSCQPVAAQEEFAARPTVGAFGGDSDSRFFPRTYRARRAERGLPGPLLATPSLIAGPFRSDTQPRDEDATSRRRRMSLTAGLPKEGRSRVRRGAPNEDRIRAARRRAAAWRDRVRHGRSSGCGASQGFTAREERADS